MNFEFTNVGSDGQPLGWFDSHGFVDGVSTEYEFKVVARRDGRGNAVRMQYPEATPWEFGSLMQRCPAAAYVNQVVQFHGTIRSHGVDKWAGLWVRVDDENRRALFFDNMHDRAIRGTTDWTTCSISVTVPAGAAWLNYGVVMAGVGTVWATELRLYVNGVAVT